MIGSRAFASCCCCPGSVRHRRNGCSSGWPPTPIRSARCPTFRRPRDRLAAGASLSDLLQQLRSGKSRLAGGDRLRPPLVRAAPRTHARGRDNTPGRPAAARADRGRLSVAHALSDRTDARSAGRHQRPGRRAAAGRGLPHPLDDPFGEGAGMEIGVRAQRRRRLHPVRSRGRARPRKSRRSGGCSTSP